MAKKAALQIVTANLLAEGNSVFLAEDGWTSDHRRALVVSSADAAATLEASAKRDEDRNFVVGVYLVEVERDASGAPQPTHYREKLRVRARPSFWADAALPKSPAARRFAETAHVSL